MKELIQSIAEKHKDSGIDIYPPATVSDILAFEQKVGFSLPTDFKQFYSVCNGFGGIEDIFNIVPLSEITSSPKNYGANWYYFSEYMIYSDMWGLRLTASGQYEIFNGTYPATAMTSSLEEFLNRFLKGNVFDDGGLYKWQDELGIKATFSDISIKKAGMRFFPFMKKQYLTVMPKEEIISRVERTVAKPDRELTFQKIISNRILEGKITKDGFIVVIGRYGMTYGKRSLLPYLIARFKPAINDKTRLNITIQPSLGSGLVILGIVYILAAFIIYISWTKGNLEGIIVPGVLIVVTYISMLLKFNREKKTYLHFIENVILQPDPGGSEYYSQKM